MPINPAGKELLNFERILKLAGIKSRMNVADLGAGTGFMAFEAARLVGDEGLVYAVDVLKEVVEKLKRLANFRGFSQVKPVWSNLEIVGGAKAIKNGTIDLAILSNTLHQNPKNSMSAILKEAQRMVKTGGRLLILEWSPEKQAPFGPKEDIKVAPAEIINAAKTLGFKLLKEFEAGPYHYGLIFVNKT